jgi:hypothetical protein
LRYEIGVAIQTGYIVWKNGPYPCGAFPDIKITRDRLVNFLLPGEKFVADRGYRDGNVYADTPTGFNTPGQRMKSLVRARHETFNCRLKKFKILSTPYRGLLKHHYIFFHALCNILQVEIEQGAELFSVEYDDINVED